jgi:hypothetical protein
MHLPIMALLDFAVELSPTIYLGTLQRIDKAQVS